MTEEINRKSSEDSDLNLLCELPTSVLVELSDKAISYFGRYQIYLMFMLVIGDTIISANFTIPSFYDFTPENYTCKEVSEKVDSTKQKPFKNYDYF